ncbi:MAG: RNA polymerase sigma factor, partial [Victivallales bacterium]|nr:RNA polymerase sigma factor [Victivallales bacterium]
QEVMIRLLKSPPSTLKDDSLSPWLCRVTRNLAVDRIRSNWREVLLQGEGVPAVGDESYDPLPAIIAQEDAELLSMILEELDEELRAVVKLRIYGGMPFREIAETLNIPIGTALWRMSHATHLLRQQWQRLQTQ